jgi:hypothetical protein
MAVGKKILSLILLASVNMAAYSETMNAPLESDPHRNELGFFDLHVCNWPDRPKFYKSLFSSTRFTDIAKMEIFMPDGKWLGQLNLNDYMRIVKKGKPEKRVFLNDIDVPEGAGTGWYDIRVTTNEGKVYHARDYVIMSPMQRVDYVSPADGASDIPMPGELVWKPVAGAAYYQVYVREAFDNKIVVSSKLLNEPRYVFKPDELKPGGYYTWAVHARDVNEHILLGDFNHGSLSRKFEFSVAE